MLDAALENSPKLGDAAHCVSEKRLWDWHLELAKIGSIPNNGVCRLALSKEDGQARALVASWARELQMTCAADSIGNIFFRHESSNCDPQLDPVLAGSHLDSEPNGGRFDGVFGVLAALEAVRAIQFSGIAPLRPIEVVIWTNEEGSRFRSSYMGSRAFLRPDSLPEFLAETDDNGVAVFSALKECSEYYPDIQQRSLGGDVFSYLEAHIEQGPILEEAGHKIGIVTSINGIKRFEVDVIGEAAHAGTTPTVQRRDALASAARIISALYDNLGGKSELLRLTVGRLIVEPGSATVIPGHCVFSIDIRHPDQSFLNEISEQVEKIVTRNISPCKGTTRLKISANCVVFDRKLQDLLSESANALSLSTFEMSSGAGHDARYLAERCPSAMIFVPSHKGISHNPAEYTAPSDLASGARVLADAIAKLAMTPDGVEQ